jgi:catechol 2,3-dioxygenase-like lactoylglutathione lyase family enzyme
MQHNATAIRPFIGAKNFQESRAFYTALGFEESIISPKMSYFEVNAQLGFYLQNAYVKDWVDNTMLFLEVADVHEYYKELQQLGLPQQFNGVRLSSIVVNDWGKECFLHDPSGILWHFGQFFTE